MATESNKNIINDTQQKILKAASKIMTEKGVKNTSLANIAKEVGISKGTLYYHYSTKDDIIYDITDLHLNEITEELLSWISNIENDLALNEIIKVVIEKISNSETRGKLHLYLISNAVINNNSLKERFKRKYKEWRMTLEEGIRIATKGSKVNYDMLSFVLLVMLDGLTIQRMLGIEDIPFDDLATLLSNKK